MFNNTALTYEEPKEKLRNMDEGRFHAYNNVKSNEVEKLF